MLHNNKPLISIILLFLLLFNSGCTPATYAPSANENSTRNEVLAKTKTHTIRRIGDQCYLDLKAGNKKINLYDGGCVLPVSSLEYDSIEDMYHNLMYGPLSEDNIATVQYAFQLSEHGFLIPDPTQLYKLVLPSNVEPRRIMLYSYGYEFWFREKGTSPDDNIVGHLTILSQNDFTTQLDRYYDPFKNGTRTYDTSSQLPDKNGLSYDVTTEHGTKRYVLYTVQDDNKTRHIRETYSLETIDPRASETSPIIIDIYGQENGIYYTFHSSGYYATIPAYSLVPFQP